MLDVNISTDTFSDDAETVSIPCLKLVWSMTLPSDSTIYQSIQYIARGADNAFYLLKEKSFSAASAT